MILHRRTRYLKLSDNWALDMRFRNWYFAIVLFIHIYLRYLTCYIALTTKCSAAGGSGYTYMHTGAVALIKTGLQHAGRQAGRRQVGSSAYEVGQNINIASFESTWAL